MKAIANLTCSFRLMSLVITNADKEVILFGSTYHCYGKDIVGDSYEMAQLIAKEMRANDIDKVDVLVNGPGLGKSPAIKALMDNGIDVDTIKDVTPVPHNGICPGRKVLKKVFKDFS